VTCGEAVIQRQPLIEKRRRMVTALYRDAAPVGPSRVVPMMSRYSCGGRASEVGGVMGLEGLNVVEDAFEVRRRKRRKWIRNYGNADDVGAEII
jgi:hypothetical protein